MHALSSSGNPSCACDVDCEKLGDCCEDKHTVCPVNALNTKNLCPLLQGAAMYGTDLGFNFINGGKVNVLFGDTWSSANTPCELPPNNDDAQATLPIARPATLATVASGGSGTCPTLLTVDKTPANTFTPIRLETNQVCSWLQPCPYFGDTCEAGRCVYALGWIRTPLAGFTSGSDAFAIFTRGDQRACPCSGGFTCVGGICVDPSSGSYGVTPVNRAVTNIEIARRSTAARTTYVRGAQFVTNKFANLSARTVTAFNHTTGVHNFAEGNGALLMWGRAGFKTESGELPVFFMYHPLPLTVTGTGNDISIAWNPTYYAGLVGGQPTWTTVQANAKPLTTNAGATYWDDVSRPSQTNVTWIPKLKKWVMLYSGDVPDWFGPTPDDQPRSGAIHFRMADNPWGPWSPPVPALDRFTVATDMACDRPEPAGFDDDNDGDGVSDSYETPGSWVFPFEPLVQYNWTNGCVAGDLNRPRQDIFSFPFPPYCATRAAGTPSLERGNLYSPNVIPSWTEELPVSATQPYTRAANLYWYVSTWNPYKVRLISTVVELPEPQATYYQAANPTYQHKYQVRHTAGSMIRAVAGAPVIDGNTPSNADVKFTIEREGAATTDIQTTHVVYLKSTKGYLLRSGSSALVYSATKVANAQWTLVLRSSGGPSNTVLVGKTVVAFRQTVSGSARYLRKSGSTLQVSSTLDTNVDFKLTWNCAPTDTVCR